MLQLSFAKIFLGLLRLRAEVRGLKLHLEKR